MNVDEFIAAVEEGKTLGCLDMRIKKKGKYIKASLPGGGFQIDATKIEVSKYDPLIVNLIYEENFAGFPYTALKGTLMPSDWKVIE